jgi:hypothetical protein
VNELWCYLVRGSGGAALRGLRVVESRAVREWWAPVRAGGVDEAEAAVEAVASAARWLAERVAERPAGTPVRLCLDAEGSRCAWLSAPSGEARVVEAAVRTAAIGSMDEGAAGPGVWDPRYGQVGLDLSVQSLSATALADGPRGAGKPRAVDRRERLAVLAVPDLAARLLMDDLDRLGVEVESVTSLWHASASAWDPGAEPQAESGAGAGDERSVVVADSQPVTAQVLVDPSGRLVWGWSRGGKLVAAGTQRLRRSVADFGAAEPEPAEGVENARRLPAGETGAEAGGGGGSAAVVEVSRVDVGRVVTDWLAWSLQLGCAPARIVCLAPSSTVCSELSGDLPVSSGAQAVARTLAERWPGAATLGQVDEDPVATTLRRLGEGPLRRAGSGDRGGAAAEAGADPRVVLMGLTSRPRRMTRRMYRWLAGAMAAGGVALGVLAWKIERGAAEIDAAAEALRAERQAELVKVKDAVPNVERDLDPARLIRARVVERRTARQAITPEAPVFTLLDRLLAGLESVEGVRLKERLRLGSGPGAQSTLTVTMPELAAASAVQAALREKTRDLPVDLEFAVQGSDLRVNIRWREPARAGAAGGAAVPAAEGAKGGGG